MHLCLQAYAISCCHVQILLVHVPGAGGSQPIIATSGEGVMRDAIGAVLGATFCGSLVPVAAEFLVPNPAGGPALRGAAQGFVSRMGACPQPMCSVCVCIACIVRDRRPTQTRELRSETTTSSSCL